LGRQVTEDVGRKRDSSSPFRGRDPKKTEEKIEYVPFRREGGIQGNGFHSWGGLEGSMRSPLDLPLHQNVPNCLRNDSFEKESTQYKRPTHPPRSRTLLTQPGQSLRKGGGKKEKPEMKLAQRGGG